MTRPKSGVVQPAVTAHPSPLAKVQACGALTWFPPSAREWQVSLGNRCLVSNQNPLASLPQMP